MLSLYLKLINPDLSEQFMDKAHKKSLIVVVGPTAVGKTEVCVTIGSYFKTEIISADSRQFYKEMDLGTAKPSLEELSKVRHHLVNHLSIHEPYSVKEFERDALKLIEEIHGRNTIALLAGGSGLYVQALCKGIDDMPTVPTEIRASVMEELEEFGLPHLLQKLADLDPYYFSIVDKANPQRVVRAIEVSLYTKKPYSSFRKEKAVKRPFNIIMVGLNRERDALYKRIDTRMDKMIDEGLFEEAKALYPYKDLNALQTVGYSEIFGYLEGNYDYSEAVRLLKRNSRRYAKRQMTWFNRENSIKWFHPEEVDEIIGYLEEKLNS